MAITILTQDGILVNYANVISILPIEDVFENKETGESIKGFGIVAELVENEDITILGVYETGTKMEQVMAKLTEWLSGDLTSGKVFRMPNN